MVKFLGFSIFDVGEFLSFEVLKMLKKMAFSIFSTFNKNALRVWEEQVLLVDLYNQVHIFTGPSHCGV